MANTSNLGLTLIQGSDVVDYQVLNSNFNRIDNLGVDYVTESYQYGRWWVRKWASGRAEFGVDNQKIAGNDSMTFPYTWGAGLYRSNDFNFGQMPFEPYSKPYFSIVLSYATTENVGPVVQIGLAGAGKNTPRWFMLHCLNTAIKEVQWSIFGCCAYRQFSGKTM